LFGRDLPELDEDFAQFHSARSSWQAAFGLSSADWLHSCSGAAVAAATTNRGKGICGPRLIDSLA
jgi:hypothetical protein